MTLSDELLMQYVDGELATGASAAVEAALADDPAAAARVVSMRAQRDLLRRSYAAELDEPVPGRLLSIVAPRPAADPGTVVRLDQPRRRATVRERVREWSWPEWSAIAASLVLGLIVMQLATSPEEAAVRAGTGGLVANRALATALTDELASSPAPAGAVQVGLTFENSAGRLCRTFHARSAGGWSGLACNVDGEWRLSMVIEDPAAAAPGAALRTAASPTPPALLRAVGEQIRGEPLDADAERAARARHWRP